MHTSRIRTLALTPALLIAASAHAGTQFFTDPGFMNSIPHTLIDFETNKFGEPIVLAEGEVFGTQGSFYNDLGILFSAQTLLIGNPTGDVDTAVSTGASPNNVMGLEPRNQHPAIAASISPISSGEKPFSAFGVFIVADTRFAGGLRFDLLAFDGTLIDTVSIDDSVLVDVFGTARSGFIGFETDEAVATVGIFSPTLSAYAFDDLRFAFVPSAGTFGPLALAGLTALGCRRRVLAT